MKSITKDFKIINIFENFRCLSDEVKKNESTQLISVTACQWPELLLQLLDSTGQDASGVKTVQCKKVFLKNNGTKWTLLELQLVSQ